MKFHRMLRDRKACCDLLVRQAARQHLKDFALAGRKWLDEFCERTGCWLCRWKHGVNFGRMKDDKTRCGGFKGSNDLVQVMCRWAVQLERLLATLRRAAPAQIGPKELRWRLQN